jgi:predicted DNA binding CopG/RHH family protein
MAAGSTHRSETRSVIITFRLSPTDRAEVRRRAAEAGVSMQAYLERIVLDRPDVHDRPSGPKKSAGQGALPLAQ